MNEAGPDAHLPDLMHAMDGKPKVEKTEALSNRALKRVHTLSVIVSMLYSWLMLCIESQDASAQRETGAEQGEGKEDTVNERGEGC